jgi:signal transduction histidine kinase
MGMLSWSGAALQGFGVYQRGPSRSLAGIIFLGFVGMGAITGALGAYGLWVLSATGAFVTQTYDGSLMAVSYARAASIDFSRMEFELLRRASAPLGEHAAITADLDHLASTFAGDLAVANERAMSSDERGAVHQISGLAKRWSELRDAGEAGQAERDAIAGKLIDRLDMLVELTADHSFVARRRALDRMQFFTYSSFGAIVLALVLSAGITLLLTRRIMGPLAAAAAVADRIAGGALDTPIPQGGRDETGTLLRSMTVMQDSIRIMVEREQAQRRSAQNRLAEALENSREAIALVDAQGCIVITNSQLEAFFPILGPQLRPGMNFGDAFRHLHEFVAESGPDSTVPLLTADSEFRLHTGRWLRVSRSATEEGGFFLIISDIGDLKEREARLEEARRDAEAASEAKSLFLATISHELRTPLNAIIGFAEVMAGEMFGPLGNRKYPEYAQNIADSGKRLFGIISNVLDLTRYQAGKLVLIVEALDLGETIKQALSESRNSCEHGALSLAVDIPERCPVVAADPARLQQIIENLMSNAIKFTAPGGAITVSAGRASHGEFAEIRISDTGIGMTEDEIDTAFTVFGQVDNRLARRYEGAGLGLPLSKCLVELHGGALSIISAPTKGTTVIVTLPCADATTPVQDRLHAESPAALPA